MCWDLLNECQNPIYYIDCHNKCSYTWKHLCHAISFYMCSKRSTIYSGPNPEGSDTSSRFLGYRYCRVYCSRRRHKVSVNASDIPGATTSLIHLRVPGTNGLDLSALLDNPAHSRNDKMMETGELTKESGLFEYLSDLDTP